MKRVTGLGGIFFKAKEDNKSLYDWYEKHLGIKQEFPQGSMFKWRDAEQPDKQGMTIFSIFTKNSDYMDPGPANFMLNFMVEDIDAVLAALKDEGVKIDEKREDTEYGRFAWVYDPEGNKIELWQPPVMP